jgi:hypothetical protein
MGTPHGLHDIVLPEPVSWMPQTIGWAIVLAILLMVALVLAIRMRRRWRANAYRRRALGELDRIESAAREADPQIALADLPELIKRTALAQYPRPSIAALSGKPWLRFLDESYGGSGFSDGPVRHLLSLTYGPRDALDVTPEESGALIALVRQWVRRHRVRV